MGLFSLLTGYRRVASLDAVNIASPQFKTNPYPFYARLRAEAPVYRIVLPTREPAWLVSRYDDAVTVLKDDRLVKATANALTPQQAANRRWFREDVTIAGVTIPRGEMVFAAIASANRDERQFAHSDTLDITREPNRHLAFGLGTHFCLGASLARLEGQIAIATLLRRAPELRLATSPASLGWRGGMVLRGLASLPVEF